MFGNGLGKKIDQMAIVNARLVMITKPDFENSGGLILSSSFWDFLITPRAGIPARTTPSTIKQAALPGLPVADQPGNEKYIAWSKGLGRMSRSPVSAITMPGREVFKLFRNPISIATNKIGETLIARSAVFFHGFVSAGMKVGKPVSANGSLMVPLAIGLNRYAKSGPSAVDPAYAFHPSAIAGALRWLS
jgi:hypothetical protein